MLDNQEIFMAMNSSTLGYRILWTEEPGGLLSIGSHKVGHDWSNLAYMHALEVMSHSVWPLRLQPARLLGPWHFPGKSTGGVCHFLPQGIFPIQRSTPPPALSPALAGRFFTTEPPGKKTLYSPPNISFHLPWKTLVPQVLMSLWDNSLAILGEN